ncbi:carboxypeptidase-like regulatory domain-containing protein [Granulicella tundricola]|nr:carboxypeptidase-like regulatory domain-containing protein [Granulicella tundricola]
MLALPCCRAAFGSDASGAPVFRISGIVLNSRDGSPVARCRVSADQVGSAARADRPSQQSAPGVARRGPGQQRSFGLGRGQNNVAPQGAQDAVVTDARGNFSLTVSHAGMWRVTAAARGFHSQAYEEHEGYSTAIALTAAVPDMALSFRINPDAVITGIVFDEAGEPVRQAQVSVETLGVKEAGRAPANQAAGFAQTDDRGHYEISSLTACDYHLSVQAHPWYAAGTSGRAVASDPSLDVVYPATWFPAALDAASAETIHLRPGEERQADVHLTPLPSVHLKIPRNDANLPAGSEPRGIRPPMISSISNSGAFIGMPQVTTSATEWDMGGLAPGTYQVRVPGALGETPSLVQLKIGPGSSTVIGLEGASAPSKVSISIDGVPDRTVERVILTDVDSGQTYVSNIHRKGRGPNIQSDSDSVDDDVEEGVRSILVPPHQYEVSLVGSDGVFLTGIQATGAQVNGRTVEVMGAASSLIIHAATGRAEVTGVVSQSGKPASSVVVLLVPSTFGQPNNLTDVGRDQTNTDGSFILQNVIPGQYILVAIDHGWEVNWHDPTTLARYLSAGTPVLVKASAHLHQDIEASLP